MDTTESGPFNLEMRWLEEISFYYRELIDAVGVAMNVDRPTYAQIRTVRAATIQVVLALRATGRFEQKDLEGIKNLSMAVDYTTPLGMKIIVDSGFKLGGMIADKNLFKKKYGDVESKWKKI